ncbi:glucarate dehydratase family protein [soil metagenome]
MKIKDFRIHSIAIADPPLRSSYGLHAPYALRTIIELENEDGIIGINETYGGDAQTKALEGLREQVIGINPFRLTGLLNPEMKAKATGIDLSQTYHVPGENPWDTALRNFAAIEVACLDLIGKSLGYPACDLLGGQVRDKVAFSAYPFYKHAGGGGEGDDVRDDEYGEALSPEGLVQQVKKMIDKYGFKSIKFKAGVLDPDQEVETVKLMYQEFGPGVPLRMDPNSAWSVDTSIRVGKALANELDRGGYLEDPTASLEGMAEVRKRLLAQGIDIPLASNVAVTSFADILQCVKMDAVQIILCDHHYWGGMRQVQHLAKLAETFNIGLSMHSNSHLGVSLMAMAHVAAATPHLTYACDTHYPWQSEKDEIVAGGRIEIKDGFVTIPDKPGLGVELDYDQLERGKELYKKIPYKKRDDTAEMRKHVDPNWERILPCW